MNNGSMDRNSLTLFPDLEVAASSDGSLAVSATSESWWVDVRSGNAGDRSQPGTLALKRPNVTNVSWFAGIYAASLVSFTGVVGGVRWMLALI